MACGKIKIILIWFHPAAAGRWVASICGANTSENKIIKSMANSWSFRTVHKGTQGLPVKAYLGLKDQSTSMISSTLSLNTGREQSVEVSCLH